MADGDEVAVWNSGMPVILCYVLRGGRAVLVDKLPLTTRGGMVSRG